MKPKYYILLLAIPLFFNSCISTKSTLQNVDNTAIKPTVVENKFLITEYALDEKYGFNKDYPINIGFDNERFSDKNIQYYFNALQGKLGEKIIYTKKESCCPFPTKRSVMGAGTLDVYEISFEGKEKKYLLYFNIFDKGKLLCPKGFELKK